MSRKEVVKDYRDQFLNDNIYFRDCKQVIGLTNFHTRRFRDLVPHTAMSFLSQIPVLLAKFFDKKLLDKTVS